ncbi:MAG: hypothetical protein ACRDSJ_23770 [Rubrobacteraceae bacterium]
MSERNPISIGASAAKDFAEACERACESSSSLRLEVVRDLARDLERELEGLSRAAENDSPEVLAEAAQRCADLATLAACNAEGLEPPEAASEAVRLAAEAARSLGMLAPDEPESKRLDLVGRDVRSASWKASLAARQMDEAG